jgi:hypothetical protein
MASKKTNVEAGQANRAILPGLVGLMMAGLVFCQTIPAMAVEDGPVASPKPSDLYAGRIIVTGRRAETRDPALSPCLEDVLVKVSADPGILKASGLGEVTAQAEGMISEYSYHDRMESIPVHDEQGSRDRPYDLTVYFDPASVNSAITRLGFNPWLQKRPTLFLSVEVHFGERHYPVTLDGTTGQSHREAILDAAWKRGLSIDLQKAQENTTSGPPAGSPVLAGDLTWNPDALAWTGRWRFGANSWEEQATGFDGIYRDALGRVLPFLRGRPAP